MIYKREDYVEEAGEEAKFPVKQIEVLRPLEGGGAQFIGRVGLGIQTPMGVQQIPITFEIEAQSVEEAFARFEASAGPRIEETRKALEEELQKARREASGRIVRPGELGLAGQPTIVDMDRFKK